MDIHIKFKPGQQREFLLKVEKISKLSANRISKLAGIARRTYSDWRREKFSVSLKAAEIFYKRFGIQLPEDEKLMVSRWREVRLNASKVGGMAHYRKYGSPGTPEGRKKGGKKALAIMRRKGIIPPAKKFNTPISYNDQLAEMVGILLGDGGLTSSQVVITLNGEADKEYVPFVRKLSVTLFGEEPKLYPSKDSKAVNLCHSGVNLVRYLLGIGLRIGNKVKYQVDVPSWIKANKVYRISCLRGLMDTDGGVFLHRYKVGGKQYAYTKISFSNRSVPLLQFVAKTLRELGLNPKVIDHIENKKVWLYNVSEVKLYLSLVGTHNPRLLKHI